MFDVVAQMGPSFLGSRLKRLGERMQASAAGFIAAEGLPLLPGHMPVLAALRTGSRTVGELAEASRTSQPGISRVLGQLEKLELVTDCDSPDLRTRTVTLTPAGDAMVRRLVDDIWPRIGGAADQIMQAAGGDFLRQLASMEDALVQASIADRASAAGRGGLRVREYDPSLAHEFHQINAEWIDAMFAMEQTDREVLENPQQHILDRGGDILFVEAPGLGIVGTCALQKTGPAAFELTKMGVRETARGLKAGEFLLQAVIERARHLGADPLYLLTNRKCAAAIHLYEKLGFHHDAEIMARYGARYERCNVAMRYRAA